MGMPINELTERCCDALLLAYSPDRPIKINQKGIYCIPNYERIGNELEYALREILGEKKGATCPSNTLKKTFKIKAGAAYFPFTLKERLGINKKPTYSPNDFINSNSNRIINWNLISHVSLLGERISKGLQKITLGTLFNYLRSETTPIKYDFFPTGRLSKFDELGREKIARQFESYWDSEEKEVWAIIHIYMHNYSLPKGKRMWEGMKNIADFL